MSSLFSRSLLTRGPGYVTWNSATFFTRSDIVIRHPPGWEKVGTSNYGRVDEIKKDMVIKIPLMLWGQWDATSIGALFPAAYLTPVPGASVFGAGSDKPLVIQARNNDRITYTNAQLTRLANLHIGADQNLFAAEVEFTALLGAGFNPEDAGSYFVIDTHTYSDVTANFDKSNFRRARASAAWGAFTGYGSILAQKGFNVSWNLDLKPVVADGYGTVDLTVGEDTLVGEVKCIPLGPTLANALAAIGIEAQHGKLASGLAGDFVITSAVSGGPLLTLKNAFMVDTGVVFGVEPLRMGEATWRTTTGFSAGVPAARAVVSSV